jgi:hypothetical protein
MVGAWSYWWRYTIEANGTSGDPVAPGRPPQPRGRARPGNLSLVRRQAQRAVCDGLVVWGRQTQGLADDLGDQGAGEAAAEEVVAEAGGGFLGGRAGQ